MKDEDVKQLVERCDQTSFLLGTIMGGITVILDDLQHGLTLNAEEGLKKLHQNMLETISKLFYKEENR